MRRSFLILLLLLFASKFFLQAQEEQSAQADSSGVPRKVYSGPRKASLLSAVLPGAGQIYNRKYWKVPVIYAGIGGLGYLFSLHNSDVQYFSRNLAAMYDDDTSTQNISGYDTQQLITLKRESRRLRDFSALGLIIIYLINIADANVDAHLKTFDVSDDLSLHLKPFSEHVCWGQPGNVSAGLTLTLKFKK